MKTLKFLIWLSIFLSCLGVVVYVFWSEEVRFWQPTPKPNYVKEINKGELAPLKVINRKQQLKRPLLLHFFNPDCPCSRFNFKEFKKMTSDYHGKIDFLLVAQTETNIPDLEEEISSKLFNEIDVIIDTSGKVAKEFGIYSSPQVVLVNEDGYIYYKGNYNSTRYCTKKETAYAAISIDELLGNKKSPDFNQAATTPYGCVLPSYVEKK